MSPGVDSNALCLTPATLNVGSITKAQLEEIANIKLPDLNTTKITSAMKIVEGTAPCEQ